jgi:hypothetical protein
MAWSTYLDFNLAIETGERLATPYRARVRSGFGDPWVEFRLPLAPAKLDGLVARPRVWAAGAALSGGGARRHADLRLRHAEVRALELESTPWPAQWGRTGRRAPADAGV